MNRKKIVEGILFTSKCRHHFKWDTLYYDAWQTENVSNIAQLLAISINRSLLHGLFGFEREPGLTWGIAKHLAGHVLTHGRTMLEAVP